MDVQQPCELTPTLEQVLLLSKQRNVHDLSALHTADFVGRQDYIDRWVGEWFDCLDIPHSSLPLCVSETLHVQQRLQRQYRRLLATHIAGNNLPWVQTHYIAQLDDFNPWNYVLFKQVSPELFRYLWKKRPVSLDIADFVVQAHRIDLWEIFVAHHGATATITPAVRGEWLPGVQHCIDEGANIEKMDVVQYCVRHPDIFNCVTQVPTCATPKAFREFIFQKHLGRVGNDVEEWFFCHGYQHQILDGVDVFSNK
jgi:hypothetical protein